MSAAARRRVRFARQIDRDTSECARAGPREVHDCDEARPLRRQRAAAPPRLLSEIGCDGRRRMHLTESARAGRTGGGISQGDGGRSLAAHREAPAVRGNLPDAARDRERCNVAGSLRVAAACLEPTCERHRSCESDERRVCRAGHRLGRGGVLPAIATAGNRARTGLSERRRDDSLRSIRERFRRSVPAPVQNGR